MTERVFAFIRNAEDISSIGVLSFVIAGLNSFLWQNAFGYGYNLIADLWGASRTGVRSDHKYPFHGDWLTKGPFMTKKGGLSKLNKSNTECWK